MKPVIFTHQNPLLENFETLQQEKPEQYAGFVYLWKCIPEDMFYIGSHKGTISDEYRGSGKRFKRAFEYHGIREFKRIIVEYVADSEQIKVREQEWMNKLKAKKSSRFYNANNAVSSLAV